MSSRMRFPVAVVLLAVSLALLAAPAVMAEAGNPYYTLAHTGRTNPAGVASRHLAGPNTAVAALTMTSSPTKATHAMVRLSSQPNASAAAVSWIMPSTPLWILGMSEDLAFYAVTMSEKSRDVSGWVAVGDVSYKPVVERANRLAMVYRQRDTRSQVVNVLYPEQAVRLFGISPDGRWAAVASLGAGRTTGWVQITDLRRDYAAAQMSGATKTHVRPDASSPVFETLSLGQRVVMTGRSADGSWVALMSQDDKRFLGWARPEDMQYNMNLAVLVALA